jgi:hypothetical protein
MSGLDLLPVHNGDQLGSKTKNGLITLLCDKPVGDMVKPLVYITPEEGLEPPTR